MVYCTRCGTQNLDTAANCSNCGAPLLGAGAESRPYTRHEYRQYYAGEYSNRHHGSGFGLLIAGLFIIIFGLAVLLKFDIWSYFWPIILVLIGVWILMLGLRRNRRYRQAPPT
jgi:hypothetical protein